MSIIPYDYAEAPPAEASETSQGRPTTEVVEAIESGVSYITRRVAVYESDGITPWGPSESRLVSGAVNVDYNSPERRKLDLNLENSDKAFRLSPTGFWYDKIIKVWRGVRYPTSSVFPSISIVETPSDNETNLMVSILSRIGYSKITKSVGSTGASLNSYDWILSYTGSAATAIAADLQDQFNRGKKIITVSTANTSAELPFYTAGTGRSPRGWAISPVSADTPTSGSFVAETSSPAVAGWGATATDAWATPLAVMGTGANPSDITATVATNVDGGYWLDLRLPNVNGAQAQALLRAALDYMRGYEEYRTWETQIGEFMIDGIGDSRFPHQVKVTGRDYVKKLLNSKLGRVTTFTGNTYTLREVITAVAINGGIRPDKIKLSMGNEMIASDMSFDKGTPRWEIIRAGCEAYNYEVFFDGVGNLIVRRFLDPTTSPVAWEFGTGPNGNLVTYDRSTNDSRIFNHIIVNGEPADGADRLPYFGEAYNDDPTSPTSRARIGDRVDVVNTNWLQSDQECIDLARSRLKIAALESYELNFSSIYYPWLEAGEIASVLDPDANDTDPTKFLIDSISYPLDLGPMSATGKRVTFVGDSGNL